MKHTLKVILILLNTAAFAQPTDSATFFFKRGMEAKAARYWAVASKHFDNTLRLNPNYTKAYIENGYINLEMRRTDAAIKNFAKAIELEPDNNAAIKQLMYLYFDYRNYEKAISFAQRCKDCDSAQRVIAISYFQQEDFVNAEKALLLLLTKTPNDAEANYTLGRTYMDMEQEKKSIFYYEKAVGLDSTRSSWLNELALLCYNINDYKNAIVYFKKAAANGFKQSFDNIENLAFSYMYAGQYEEAEKAFADLMARKPGNKDLLRVIAQAYYDKKLYDKSLEYCQKLMELDAKDAQALYQAGMCFQKKGEKTRGQAMCDKAIEMDPSLAKLKKQQQMGAGL